MTGARPVRNLNTGTATTLPSRRGSSRRRAAITLVALGPQRAASVLRGLHDSEVTALLSEVTRLGAVDPAEIRSAFADLDRGLPQTAALAAPTLEFAQDVLTLAVGEERATELAPELERPAAFDWLADIDVATAAPVLAEYPPHVLAVTFAHLTPQLSAALMARLPAEIRTAVAVRLARLRGLHPGTVAEIEQRLQVRFEQVSISAAAAVPGPRLLADVLAQTDRDESRDMLSALSAVSAELADEVRALLFTFEDLATLPSRALQQVLATTQMRDLAMALKDAPDEVQSTLLTNLSERNRETLLEEIELLTGLPPAEVKAARASVVANARRLEDAGTISLDRAEATR